MLTKLWCFVIGGVLMTLGIMGNVVDVMDKWEAIGILGLISLVFGVLQTLYDTLEK